MIVKMSKVAVTGPRDLLLPVLETIRRSAALHIDPDIRQRIHEGAELQLRPLALGGEMLAERLFFEDLRLKIERLLAILPEVPARESYLNPPRAITAIATLVGKHIGSCEERASRRTALESELAQLNRYLVFLATVESLAPGGREGGGLEFIGVEVRDPAALEQLTRAAGHLLLGAEVRTARADDGSYIGLLTTEKELAEQLKESLRGNHIPEVTLPAYLKDLPLPEQITAARAQYDALLAERDRIEQELRELASKWRALYQNVQSWLDERLALLKTSASLYETDRCFVLFGWIPSARLAGLTHTIAEQHGDTVVVEEQEILRQDLAEVPVALSNPAYFQPFELLVRLLPLPRYTSLDPTPFIGIFFPLFFGMILGDVGYGLILLLAALGLIFFVRKNLVLRQSGRILLVASIYSIIFGALYGECFGELGAELLGLSAACIDRRTSLMPMIYFALAMGSVHVLVGLGLGLLSAWKGRRTREAVFRLFSILVLICLLGILASYFAPVAALIRKPLIVTAALIAPILLLTGGLLAPFELLRHLGNIVSYVRIMAVGLASVMLAYVANNLAGAAGSVWIGVTVAILLHAFNLLLGVFAPTIHALRLHYVEFFGKFLEPGGRHYKPLTKGE